ncbi:MAG: TrkA family potassium uptake protein [Deltaproteobacteria bacterium]|nr:TrkA family potassium uptake protein [Candidatus Anaeroferrophillus wilburensis]MBN2889872.1 TrkA family potassium uptake protein [Deltaproteobacteria bacterium]
MRLFVVIGLGSFGYYAAKRLYALGQEVMVIDHDKELVQSIKDQVSRAVVADATDRESLERLGLADVDVALVSVGDRLDTSILITLYLKEMGVKEVVVKAVTDDHGKILEKIGASMVIFPERDSGVRLADRLGSENVIEHLPLSEGYGIMEMAADKGIIGQTLRTLKLRNRYGIQVIAIKEMVPERMHFPPDPDFVIKDSDMLIVVGPDEGLEALKRKPLI